MIEVRNLTKRFGRTAAVEGVTFTVNPGDIFGFIGPNGAGKTTTIRVLATLLDPTEGDALVDCHSVMDAPGEVRRLIGYMPDGFGVYEGITVREYLDFFASAYGIERRRRRRVLDDILALTDLAGVQEKLARTLSKGMRQRLCLAKTLVHDPKVLILDEPANGLDPRARIEFRALLKALREMGKTILISSHILTELSDVCNAVAVLERGRLVASGDLSRIRETLAAAPRLRIEVLERAEEAAARVRGVPEVAAVTVEDHTLCVQHRGDRRTVGAIVGAVTGAGIAVTGVREERTDLEDLFMRLTQGEVG